MQRISIDRIQIRLKGISPSLAQAAVQGLGARLLELLAERDLAPGAGRSMLRISSLDMGKLEVKRDGKTSSALGNLMAQKIADSVPVSSGMAEAGKDGDS
jgi:hypothetical protein